MSVSRRPVDPVRVRVVESAAELASLADAWDALHERAAVTSVFAGYDWQKAWWDAYGDGRPLRVLVAYADDALVGILPLYVETTRPLGYPVRLLRFVGTGADTSPDDLGPTLAPAREAEVARALADAVLALPGWDVLSLTDMDPACAFTPAMTAAARRARLACLTGRSERIVYVTLPASFDAWLASLHRDRRYRIKNARKKLEAAHPDARFFVWSDAATLDDGISRLAALHQKRWQRAGEPHSFSSPGYLAFHRAVMAACFRRDRLRLYALELSGQTVAMYYFYKFRDRTYLMQSGFDPDFASLKPGHVLLGHVIEHAIGEGHRVLDFLRGDHRYKEELADGERETVYLTALRWRPGAAVYLLRRLILPSLRARREAKLMASDSPLKRLFVQASHYGVTSLLTMIAGLISFPVLTRLFSVADYGTMSLVAATLTVSTTFGKVGVQHSTLRYHSEIDAGKSRFTMAQLYSTTFLGMGATSLLVMLALTLFAQFAPMRWLGDVRLRHLFAIASLLIVVQVLESALVNVLRAEQRTSALMKYQIAKKYFGLGSILFAVLVISRSLTAFYSANVLSDTLAFVLLAAWLFGRSGRPRPRLDEFSRPLYRELLAFGIPMMIGYELSGLILAVGDRYVIDGLIGAEPLGLYAAAYNLCQYVQALVIASLGQAIMPIYLRMWDRQGVTETAAFIGRSLRTYAIFGVPIIAGLAAVGPELLPSLASEKYAGSAIILPWVIGGMVVDGANSMVGAGLFIHRKTRTIMTIVLSSAALNIVLNLILVPRIGILGSAIATLVCYAAAALGMAAAGRSLLPIALPWATLLRAGAASVAMYFAVSRILPHGRLLAVGVRTTLGAVVYGGIMVLISPEARELARGALNRLRRKKESP